MKNNILNFKNELMELMYTIKSKPVFTLNECLNKLNDNALKFMYLYYKDVLNSNKKIKNEKKEKMIQYLEQEIVENFKYTVKDNIKEERIIIEEALKNNNYTVQNTDFLNMGFMFCFKNENETNYIIPNELLKIYSDYSTSDEKKKNDVALACLYFSGYLLLNGVIEKDFIEDVLNKEYELNVNIKDVLEEMEAEVYIIENKYYSFIPEIDGKIDGFIEDLIDLKQTLSYKVLTEIELKSYLSFIYQLNKYWIDKFKKEIDLTNMYLYYEPLEKALDSLDLTKKEKEKFKDFLEDKYELFRYWTLNGRTKEEFDRECFIENMPFSKKPKKTDLLTCLNTLSEDLLNELEEYYEVNNKEDLKDKIIENTQNLYEIYETFEIEDLINSNNNNLSETIETQLLNDGICYLYKDKDEIKVLFPDEIMDIFKGFLSESIEDNYKEYVVSYLNMNGNIEKEKLREILKQYHDIEIKIKELDEIVKDVGFYSIKNYYSIFEELDEELIPLKSQFKNYNQYNFIYNLKENELFEELNNLLTKLIPLSTKKENVYTYCHYLIKMGLFNSDILNNLLLEFNINIKESQKRTIIDLYKKYKAHISVWRYNGYSITEAADFQRSKTEKIGRNDPCTCGSGKKYKQCCGK